MDEPFDAWVMALKDILHKCGMMAACSNAEVEYRLLLDMIISNVNDQDIMEKLIMLYNAATAQQTIAVAAAYFAAIQEVGSLT
jgi:hypothetical protein